MIVPFTCWQRYGDVQVVRDRYGEMAAWIDSLTAHSSGLIRPAG
ncbi:alpha-L-rhamnosidase-related protein [Streptomyces sp. NPDC001739]